MKTTRLPGVHVWSEFQPDRGIDFNGFLIEDAAGNLLVDPVDASPHAVAFAQAKGGAAWILVTNADHWRAADAWREATGAKIAAPEAERERLGPRAANVDHWFAGASDLPSGLGERLDLHWLHGGKSPAEPVLYLKDRRALLFSDLVRSHVSGELRMLPDDKLGDASRARADVLALRDTNLDAILLGDGDSLFVGARAAWLDFLRELGRSA